MTLDTPNATERVWVLGQRVKIIPTDGEYSFVDITAPAKVPGLPPRFHRDCSEFFYVIEGELEVMI